MTKRAFVPAPKNKLTEDPDDPLRQMHVMLKVPRSLAERINQAAKSNKRGKAGFFEAVIIDYFERTK